MKRFLLFAGLDYYPSGGWKDFVQDFDTEDELWAYVEQNPNLLDYYCWYHTVDTKHGEILQNKRGVKRG